MNGNFKILEIDGGTRGILPVIILNGVKEFPNGVKEVRSISDADNRYIANKPKLLDTTLKKLLETTSKNE
ncbi:MAG: hypothetical protein LBF79_01625 [Dysgonamonadaceae bacterium]|jgi:hypothetical protein|nr:hypothetical protein [Dysgonamonadaceae bacterium]